MRKHIEFDAIRKIADMIRGVLHRQVGSPEREAARIALARELVRRRINALGGGDGSASSRCGA